MTRQIPPPEDFHLTEPDIHAAIAEAELALAKARAAELSARILAAYRAGEIPYRSLNRWPELYALWAEVIAVALHRARGEPPEVQTLAVLAAISGASGRTNDRHRIPSPEILKEVIRDAQMFAEYNFRNIEHLRRKYGYATKTDVYAALEKHRRRVPIVQRPVRLRRGRLSPRPECRIK
jgi:Mor family transcriptional regulator